MAGNCVHFAGECCLDLGTSFLGSAVAVGILGIGVSVSRLALSDIENGLLGVLDTVADLCWNSDQTLSTARDNNPD